MIKKIALSIMGLALVSFGVAAQADSSATVQADQLLSLLTGPASAPATSAGSPTGYGSGWGTMYAGASASNRTQTNNEADGSFVVGMGFGDPHKYVGMDVSAAVISVNTTDNGFGEDGNVNVKISRYLSDTMAFAVGGENLGAWGSADDNKESYYGVLSNQFGKKYPLTMSLGFGTGSYQSDLSDDDDAADTNGLFGSMALQLNNRFSVIADWTGTMINTGFSFVPVKTWPVTASITATDVSNRTGNKVPIVASLGYSYSFK